MLSHDEKLGRVCFQATSGVGKNGFVEQDFCFVGRSMMKQVHGIASGALSECLFVVLFGHAGRLKRLLLLGDKLKWTDPAATFENDPTETFDHSVKLVPKLNF